MEKINLGLELSRTWYDPSMIFIYMVPILWGAVGYSGFLLYKAVDACMPYVSSGKAPEGDALTALLQEGAFVFAPWFACFCLYTLYHGMWLEDKSLDTSKYITFRDPAKAAYWKHRKIPMCELYEWYINEQCDFNPKTRSGDCYEILANHRGEFVNYKTTWRQIKWLCFSQFLPAWLTCGRGLGHGNSSGKSIEETTKEIDEHYNKGNDVFSCIMGSAMVYTCGIFHGVPQFAATGHKGDYKASASDGTLEQAQFNKMNMLCDKVQLKEGETLLDIGCGWGTLLRHAVSEYGATATGVTLSSEGKIYCDMASEKQGVPTEVIHCDYRDIPMDRKFDKITSIEMAEHVGLANFVDPYLKKVKGLMKNKDSMFLLQVAGLRKGANWQDTQWGLFMVKYVFPGADASTPLNWYVRQCELAGLEVHSVENIGIHYSHTLHKWYDNWMSHKEEILSGEIDAISDHTKGTHLFRLNEFTWAWCAIHAEQGGGTCYQLLCHPLEYTFPRNCFVNGDHVSHDNVTGAGLRTPGVGNTKKTPAKKASTKKTPAKKASTKKTPAKKPSAKKASAKKTPAKATATRSTRSASKK